MSVRGPNDVRRAVQTDPTLLRYSSAITEQKNCWELLAEKFDQFQTWHNMQQGVHTDVTCNIQQCWESLANKVASVCTGLYPSYHTILNLKIDSLGLCNIIFAREGAREPLSRKGPIYPVDYGGHSLTDFYLLSTVMSL